MAVCPHGALRHKASLLGQSPAIDKEKIIDAKQSVQFLRTGRLVHVLKDKPVEKEILNSLIKVASFAPTGSNLQLAERLQRISLLLRRQILGGSSPVVIPSPDCKVLVLTYGCRT